MRILLIRHGAMMDTGGITGGNADPKLTKEGAAQAQKLGSFLKENHPDIFPTVISSHQIRSYKTAKKAFPKEFHIIPTRKLREVDHAGTEGKDPAVRNREWAEFEDAKVASGEAADDPYYLWKNTPY